MVGIDVQSTYCYLLSLESSRDATTWGIRLLELPSLRPEYTIADGGCGLRAGQREAWPSIPCYGDVFHPLLEFGKLTTFCEHRALKAIGVVEDLERKMTRAKRKGQGQKYGRKLGHARAGMEQAISLSDDLQTLSEWLQKDILWMSGEDLATRQQFFDFIVSELEAREFLCPHRIRPVRRFLENQRDSLLGFVGLVDKQLSSLADEFDVDEYWVRELFKLQRFPKSESSYWEGAARFYEHLGHHYYALEQQIQQVMESTVRASSLVENVNSRLRSYFFLRKSLGPDYLHLLQYFFNHRRYLRSRRPERVNKSPVELLTGEEQPHWLESLGFELFKRDRQAA